MTSTQPGSGCLSRFCSKRLTPLSVADLIMLLGNQCKPYEVNLGETAALEEELTKQTADFFYHMRCFPGKNVKL